MISPLGEALPFTFYFTASQLGKTGLTVTVDVYNPAGTLIVSGAAATAIGGGLYRYTLAGASVTTYGAYVAIGKTTDVTVDVREVPSEWVVTTWAEQVTETLGATEYPEGTALDCSLAGLRTALRIQLNDYKAPGAYSTVELDKFINLAYRESVVLSKCRKVTKSTQAAGTIAKVAPAPTAAGTGYTVGDLLTITTGGTNGKVEVVAVSAGVVLCVRLNAAGAGYTVGSGKATSGGTGTGCTVRIEALEPTLVENLHSYTWPAIFEAIGLSWGGAPLAVKHLGDMDLKLDDWDRAAADTPTDWMHLVGSSVRIHPKPSAAAIVTATATGLRCHGYARPDDLLAETDRPDAIPDGYAFQTILLRAEAHARYARQTVFGNIQIAQDRTKEWLIWVERINKSVRNKP